MLALKYVEIHLKHSNRTYKKVTSFLVMNIYICKAERLICPSVCLVVVLLLTSVVYLANHPMHGSNALIIRLHKICNQNFLISVLSSPWHLKCQGINDLLLITPPTFLSEPQSTPMLFMNVTVNPPLSLERIIFCNKLFPQTK